MGFQEGQDLYCEWDGWGWKSELAKEYARRCRDKYRGGVYWIESEDKGRMLRSFINVAKELERRGGQRRPVNLGTSHQDQMKLKEYVHEALKVCGGNYTDGGW